MSRLLTFELLERASQTRARTEKEQLLSSIDKGGDREHLISILQMTFDWRRTYGLAVDGRRFESATDMNGGMDMWPEFQALAEGLASRELSGHAARDTVTKFLNDCDPFIAKWYARILNKDLKAGIGDGTVEKVFPGILVPFQVQLCDTYRGEPLETMHYIQPKLDGHRCIIMAIDGRFRAYGRGGKEMYNVEHILEALDAVKFHDYVFDGEIFAENWNVTSTICRKSTAHPDARKLRFLAFDVVAASEWEEKQCTAVYSYRRELLNNLLNIKELDSLIEVVPSEMVATSDAVHKITTEYVTRGYEGSVLKDPYATYNWKRGTGWRKVKFMATEDFPVVDAIEGTGRLESNLGALVVEVSPGKISAVGSGFTDLDRAMLWKRYTEGNLTNVHIEVRFQEKTVDGALRFPVFVRLREDKVENA